MKFKILIVLVLLFWSGFSMAQNLKKIKEIKISFNAKNITANQVFKIIESKSEYIFCYSPSDISPKLLLNFNYQKQSLEKILKDLALTCNLKFLIFKQTINVAVNDPPGDRIITVKE